MSDQVALFWDPQQNPKTFKNYMFLAKNDPKKMQPGLTLEREARLIGESILR